MLIPIFITNNSMVGTVPCTATPGKDRNEVKENSCWGKRKLKVRSVFRIRISFIMDPDPAFYLNSDPESGSNFVAPKSWI
jgi:hypothetical protein